LKYLQVKTLGSIRKPLHNKLGVAENSYHRQYKSSGGRADEER